MSYQPLKVTLNCEAETLYFKVLSSMDFGGKLHFSLCPLQSTKLLNNERIFNNLVERSKFSA